MINDTDIRYDIETILRNQPTREARVRALVAYVIHRVSEAQRFAKLHALDYYDPNYRGVEDQEAHDL